MEDVLGVTRALDVRLLKKIRRGILEDIPSLTLICPMHSHTHTHTHIFAHNSGENVVIPIPSFCRETRLWFEIKPSV